MAQLGKGKLNYRCPSCFLRDLDIDMFYNKETGIYSCIRCQYRGTEEDVLEKNKMPAVLKSCTAVLKRGNNHGEKEKRHDGTEILRSSAG